MTIDNKLTGDKCEINFKQRGWWTQREEDFFVIDAVIYKDGVEKYTLTGKYTESISVTNVETGKTWVSHVAPDLKPDNSHLMYGMNKFAL